jgi:UDP-N-acetylmuramyl pentapeptide phosphotransferase/UDP-N-acetylglucosamine-1-phosphate transferase
MTAKEDAVLLAGVIALVVGLLLQPLTMRVLRRHGALDQPSERSSHQIPTVRGGGVAVVVALVLGTVGATWANGSAGSHVGLILLAVVVLCALVGLAEDLFGVPVVPRFALLLVATSPLALLPEGGNAIRVAWAVLAVAFAVAVVNATNFMDGINGISAAQGVAAGLAFAVLAHSQDLNVIALVAAAVAGAAASFAPYNVPRARVFLGDSGSYALGGALAGLLVALLVGGLPLEAVVAPLALYLADTGVTLLRRIRAGEPWHLPHRTHVYQRLTDLGMTHVQVSSLVLLVVVICSVLGAASLAASAVRVAADGALVLVLVGYLSLPRILQDRRVNA